MTLGRDDLLTQIRRKLNWYKCGYAKKTKDGKGILFKVEGQTFIVSANDIALLLRDQLKLVKVSCPLKESSYFEVI